MKFLLLIVLFCGFSSIANAQQLSPDSALNSIHFVPLKVEISSINVSLEPVTQKPNKLLLSTGWILHGLKFRSPIDEFNAMVPFDQRAFNPTTVSSFNYSFRQSYLQLNTHPGFYDW